MSKSARLFRNLLIVGVALVTPGSVFSAKEPAAIDIVKKADAIRFPTEPFQVSVKVTTFTNNAEPDVHVYQVLQKGFERSVVRTLAPASEKGQVMLLRDSDLWIFLPSVSQPVRLPLAQRLTGQVANGDLARANLGNDYTAKIIGSEDIEGEQHYVLDLDAARKGVTYKKVKYWVNAKNFHPTKVEFYSRSGKLLKSGEYSDYKKMGDGKIRPAKLTLYDGLKSGEFSVLEYDKLKKRDIADKVFTKQFLRKLDK